MSGSLWIIPAAVQRWLIIGLITSIAMTTIVGATMILAFPHASDRTASLFIGVPAMLALCFALLLAFSTVLRRNCPRAVRPVLWIGVILAPAATAVVLRLILFPVIRDPDLEPALAKAGVSGLAIAIALAYTGALSLVRTHSWLVRAMAIGTLLSVWSAAGLLLFILVGLEALHGNPSFDLMIGLVIAEAILVLLTLIGTVAVPIAVVSKASKRRDPVESIDPRVQVHFGCPKCGEKQTHRPGFVKCGKCGTGMFIEIEEPRCECGYLLYQLTGDACPECGRPVVSPVRA